MSSHHGLSSYRRIVADLESRGMMPNKRPMGTEVTRLALGRLGFAEFPFAKALAKDPKRSIIVAGTNGKGSTAATLEALCLSAGERTGLFTSPHLEEFTERYRLCGKDISQEVFVEAFEAVHGAADDLQLTQFEMSTLMAAWIFCSGKPHPAVDRLILEVGLGGKWDATNALPHGFCLITRLGLDHSEILGDTIEKIAESKFGVVSENAFVAHAALPKETRLLAEETRRRTKSLWIEADPAKMHVSARGPAGGEPVFEIESRWGRAELALPGRRGVENTALALTAFHALGFDPTKHLEALSRVRWPGRMERVDVVAGAKPPCPVYLSGDHNPQGVTSLCELLAHYPRKSLHLIVGVVEGKDLDGMLEPLFALKDASVTLTVPPYRGRKIGDYGKWRALAKGAFEKPEEALRSVLAQAGAGDLVVVTGSLYLVGQIRAGR